MFNLALLHEQRGDLSNAETWYRRAADTGFVLALFPLANLMHGRGNVEEAWRWWGRARAVGDPRALAWFRIP
ncbi:hypothetical protein KHQ06_33425 [Nocardia tengchongensis]|uniref:Sel1 repeat family protein n=1 Tax=Nocardia tengchongensis TaxID=2055889 RepID=A0ABX8CLU5_9NOCA|nr:hypothetical protein [Nocardia tengchongensis]QVI20928.1 hypothetical protein KHQ06_33425 [Nocardia tengchongensis]